MSPAKEPKPDQQATLEHIQLTKMVLPFGSRSILASYRADQELIRLARAVNAGHRGAPPLSPNHVSALCSSWSKLFTTYLQRVGEHFGIEQDKLPVHRFITPEAWVCRDYIHDEFHPETSWNVDWYDLLSQFQSRRERSGSDYTPFRSAGSLSFFMLEIEELTSASIENLATNERCTIRALAFYLRFSPDANYTEERRSRPLVAADLLAMTSEVFYDNIMRSNYGRGVQLADPRQQPLGAEFERLEKEGLLKDPEVAKALLRVVLTPYRWSHTSAKLANCRYGDLLTENSQLLVEASLQLEQYADRGVAAHDPLYQQCEQLIRQYDYLVSALQKHRAWAIDYLQGVES